MCVRARVDELSGAGGVRDRFGGDGGLASVVKNRTCEASVRGPLYVTYVAFVREAEAT